MDMVGGQDTTLCFTPTVTEYFPLTTELVTYSEGQGGQLAPSFYTSKKKKN